MSTRTMCWSGGFKAGSGQRGGHEREKEEGVPGGLQWDPALGGRSHEEEWKKELCSCSCRAAAAD